MISQALVRSSYCESIGDSIRRKNCLPYAPYNARDLKRYTIERNTSGDMDVESSECAVHECALPKADNKAIFRFLDLPPELRDGIYRELVILRPSQKQAEAGRRCCWPAIVRCNRQVNTEAASILYGQNIIDVSMCVYSEYSDRSHSISINHYLRVNGHDLKSHRWRIWDRPLDWPNYLRKAQWLRIDVSLINNVQRLPTFPHMMSPHLNTVNYALYDLYCFLHRHNDLRRLNVNYGTAGSDMLHGLAVKDLLYPLAAIAKLPSCNAIDSLPKDIRDIAEESAWSKATTKRNNPIQRYRHLSAKVASWRPRCGARNKAELAQWEVRKLLIVQGYRSLITAARLTELCLAVSELENVVKAVEPKAVSEKFGRRKRVLLDFDD